MYSTPTDFLSSVLNGCIGTFQVMCLSFELSEAQMSGNKEAPAGGWEEAQQQYLPNCLGASVAISVCHWLCSFFL